MEYLIALLFVSFPSYENPKYHIGDCFMNPTAEWRPNLIKIVGQTNEKYHLAYYINGKWDDYLGFDKFQTVDEVYTKEVECP